MKILHVITGLGVGGAERVVMEVAPRMRALGHNVSIVSLGTDSRILDQYDSIDIPVFVLKINKNNALSLLKGLFSFLRLLRNGSFDVVHAHMFHALVFSVLARLLLLEKPALFFTSHNFSGFKGGRRRFIQFTRFARDGDVVFAQGQHESLNTKKVFLIPNGVDVGASVLTKRHEYESDVFTFVFVGRLETQKDPLTLVRQFALLSKAHVRLLVVGDGYLRPEVEAEIARLGLSGKVDLLGVRTDVNAILKQADCFVMSSRWEGLPMAILEAGAVGLPVISTNVGAVSEILDGDCGWIADGASLHKVMKYVVENREEALRRGGRLRDKVVESYSVESNVRSHLNAYFTVCTQRE